MKVILYMAMTLNGYIAASDDDTSWTSKEDWAAFLAMTKKVGNAVIGRHTYDMVRKENHQIKDCLTVVMTHNPKLARQTKDTIVTNAKPQEVLQILSKKGFKTVLLCGGGIINSSFMKEGLIDEIYIDIEPLVLGAGISLFSPSQFKQNLKLLSIKKLNPSTIQLHYCVVIPK